MHVAISRCLLGDNCRYNGKAKPNAAVIRSAKNVEVVPVCPESAGKLPIPRPAAEQRDGGVYMSDGTDVTKQFQAGACKEFDRVKKSGVPLAILKAKSPSCGSDLIYDGTYSGTLTAGDGVFTRLLKQEGIIVATETMVEEMHPSVEHPVAIVLGTGLGSITDLVHVVRRIDYHDIEGFPDNAQPIEGHRFEAAIGALDGVPVIVYPGRIHLYRGYSAAEVTSLVRHAFRLGCRDIIFAGATGAIPGKAEKGLGILTDQINLTGRNPLAEWEGLRDVESPFVDMNDLYSPYMSSIARGVAKDQNITIGAGVFAGVLGPSFETQAEVSALRQLGVSYVGMSTVNEVIMAHALGMHVLGLTLAANYSGGRDVDHQSVLATAKKYEDDFQRWVRGIVHLL